MVAYVNVTFLIFCPKTSPMTSVCVQSAFEMVHTRSLKNC